MLLVVNFNVHSANVLTMRQPGYSQPGNILLDDGNTIFETLKKHQIQDYYKNDCNQQEADKILKSIMKFIVTSGLAIEKIKDNYFIEKC